MTKFYSAYDPAPPVNLTFDPDENMTEQQHVLDCDINNIIERSRRTGILGDPYAMPTVPMQYGDFTDAPSYQDAMTYIVTAQQAFEALPSNMRKRFENDPGQLIDFLGKEENRDEAIRLGLIPRPDNSIPSNSAAAEPGSSANAAPAAPAAPAT